jgi:hypothetical protein
VIALSFAERCRQARLYAAQVRVRRAMGNKYAHARSWHGPDGIKIFYRKLEHA